MNFNKKCWLTFGIKFFFFFQWLKNRKKPVITKIDIKNFAITIFSLFSKQIIDLNNSRKVQENIVQYSIIPLQQMHFKCVCAFVHIGSV